MSWLLTVCIVVLVAAGSVFADRNPDFGYLWSGFWSLADAALTVYNVIEREWGWVAVTAIGTVIMGIDWWRKRRRRRHKRTLALAGAKSRARLAKLVRRAREAATPHPVPRPVPRGTW